MPIPDVSVTQVSDSKDEEIIDLETVARVVTAKLEKDLAEVKVWNNGITWKKQEWANQQAVVKKKKEDEKAAEVQRKPQPQEGGQGRQEKGLRAAFGTSLCLSSSVVWKLTWFPVWAGCST